MSSSFIWNNLVTYSLQIGLLVGLAAFVPAMLKFRSPTAKLIYLQALLAVCLLLPVVQPWKHEVAASNIQITTRVMAVEPATTAHRRPLPWREIAFGLLAAGMLVRLGWLATGFRRLNRYRREAAPLRHSGICPTFLSREISSPVTFGLRRPVVLLPVSFQDLEEGMQNAILCHEFLHVERRDWLYTVIEEVTRAVFWFHPAIWWVLGEIQLAREQVVDRGVVDRTQAREKYVDTLLAVAGARLYPDLAPAPLFLRKRHLKQRVVSIFKEVEMSKTKLFSRLAIALAILVAGGWLVTGTLPLAAAPQDVTDAAGVTVDIGGAPLLHRAPVAYPVTAWRNRVQGAVTAEVTLDATGNVSDARVLSGPEELRRAVLDSVLQWHFAKNGPTVRQVTVGFQLPDDKSPTPAPGRPSDVVGGFISPALSGRMLKSIRTPGLSAQSRSDLLAVLPVHEGDTLDAQQLLRINQAVRSFDEHLRVSMGTAASGELSLDITAPDYVADTQPGMPPSRIKIGSSIQQAKLIRQPHPVYPQEAKDARISGIVHLSAVIAKDGTILKLEVIGGHPLLVPAAVDAVKQWQYQPTLLNGEPVEVITQIDVNFTLMQ